MLVYVANLVHGDTILAVTLSLDTSDNSVNVLKVRELVDGRHVEVIQCLAEDVVGGGAGHDADAVGGGQRIPGEGEWVGGCGAGLQERVYWISNKNQTAMKAWIPLN